MHTLMIVEDEVSFRDGLVSMIDWAAHGIAVCAAVGDGQQAWSLIQQQPPTLLLTDVRMPVLDGLQLLGLVKQADFPTQVILLSGHSEFEYAKQALRLGAFDYVLKPCAPLEVLAVVQAAIQSGEDRQRALRLAGEQLLAQWMQTPAPPDAPATLRRCQLTLADAPLQVGLVHGAVTEPVRGLLLDGLRPLYQQCPESFPYGEDWLWVGNAREALSGARLGQCLRDLRERIRSEFGVEVWIGVGSVQPDLSHLHQSCSEARQALALREDWPQQSVSLFAETTAGRPPEEGTPIGVLSRNRPPHRTVQAALQIVAAQYQTNLTLEAVARQVFVSTAYLSTLFKQEMGINFLDYLHQYRVQRARELLAREPLKVFAVAKLVGYHDERHFSSTFKKWTGVSPSQFQKSMLPAPERLLMVPLLRQ